MQQIAIITNPKRDVGGEVTRSVAAVLTNVGAQVHFDPEKLDGMSAAVILGGDGSIMHSALRAARAGVPIIGVNLGRVGYLAEVEVGDISSLARLISGDFALEERMLLDVTVGNRTMQALNDAVVSRSGTVQLVSLEVISNAMPLYPNDGIVRCDGVIVATPTGSTAYSMAAGGAAVDPRLSCICVTPVCPLSLDSRPLVLSADKEICIKNLSFSEGESIQVILTLDGVQTLEVASDDTVIVRRSETVAKFIKLYETNFFAKLTAKL